MSIECPWAEHHITVSATGNIATCCMSVPVIDIGSGQPYNIRTHTVSQAFNSKEFNSIRENLRNGIKDKNCESCWREEATSDRSLRLDTIPKYQEVFKSGKTSGLITVQLDLSNQCNLKCRTCNHSDSSMWVKEHYDVYERDKGISLIEFQKTSNTTLHKDHEFLQDLKVNVIPNLAVVRFQGGEPFLIKQQWAIVDSIIEAGKAKDILLSYHTNGTIWNQEIADKLAKFGEVNLCLSIDDIQHRFEYLRHPGKWDQVEHNIKTIIEWCAESSDTRDVLINSVVTPYNLYTIHDLLDYFISMNVPVKLHSTNFPKHFSIANIPNALKSAFLEKLQSHSFPDPYQEEIDNLITVMMNADDPTEWTTFLKTTLLHDNYRNENYQTVFPEFADIVNRYDK